MGQRENKFFELVDRELALRVERADFAWLTNKIACSETTLWAIFESLGGKAEAMNAKQSRRLKPDGYLPDLNCMIEFDEKQHFTYFRSQTFLHYPVDIRLGFNICEYRNFCNRYSEDALKKGPSGFRNPKQEFPFENGRAAQRALFDACRDILPLSHGLEPTIRIAEFQVPSLLRDRCQAAEELRTALASSHIFSGP